MSRIVIVGGGSYTWGPLFVRDLLATPELHGSTIVLHDRNARALELVRALGRKAMAASGLPFSLEATLDLDQALTGADFVILTITTGGLEAMRHDLDIAARYGVFHSVGDTVGPGGLARALRNIPVMVNLAHRMEELCPNAWLLNYTNPMTTLCRAVTRETRIRTIGLCHEFLGVRKRLAKHFGVNAEEIQARVGGINHLAWILDLKVRGRDAWPELCAWAQQTLESPLDLSKSDPFEDHNRVKARLFQVFGALPAAGDRHVAEFFPYFLTDAAERGRAYGVLLTSVDYRQRMRDEDRALLENLLKDDVDMKPFLSKTSGEAANKIISAVESAGASGGRYVGIMNLPNRGQISNLPEGAVVETFGVVDHTGAHGLALGDLPPGVHAVVDRHVANQELIVEAALTGSRELALQALINDPMVRELDTAEPMLNELLEAHRAYLPQFFRAV